MKADIGIILFWIDSIRNYYVMGSNSQCYGDKYYYCENDQHLISF